MGGGGRQKGGVIRRISTRELPEDVAERRVGRHHRGRREGALSEWVRVERGEDESAKGGSGAG